MTSEKSNLYNYTQFFIPYNILQRQGRSPRGHHEDKNASTVKSPDTKGKGKAQSPPPQEEKGGKGGKKPQSPPPKEEKGGKDKERSKSPGGKDMKKDEVLGKEIREKLCG